MAPPPTVLIACSRLVDLAGAELTTLELTEAFAGLGWSVTVASYEVGDEMRVHLHSLGAAFFDLSSNNTFSGEFHFNLAWIHHCVVADRILAEPKLILDKVVYYSLSHFGSLECPPPKYYNLSNYLVHSQESFEHFVSNYPELRSSVAVMNNSVLARYWKRDQLVSNHSLNRLAVVSNHVSEEVARLIELLAGDEIFVDVFGVVGKKVRVTPDLLRKYDAVITIGKTAQYAIAAGVPVFCYDHFGGDGWITCENFERNRCYNFSGRGGRGRVSENDLINDIYDGYKSAAAITCQLFELGMKYFVLEENISKVLENLSLHRRPLISIADSNIMIRRSGVFMELRREISFRDHLASDLRLLIRREQENAKAQIIYRDDLIDNLQNQLAAEKENARSQIIYRDDLIDNLQNQLAAEKENARSQIGYRDDLISKLHEMIEQANKTICSKIGLFFRKFSR